MRSTEGIEVVLSPLLGGLGLKLVGSEPGKARWESDTHTVTVSVGGTPGMQISTRTGDSDLFVTIPTLVDLAREDPVRVQKGLDRVGKMLEKVLSAGLPSVPAAAAAPLKLQVRAAPELVPMANEAGHMLATFTRPGPTCAAVAARLRPEEDDYDDVFSSLVAEAARKAYSEIWLTNPRPYAEKGQDQIQVVAAQANDLLDGLPAGFPGGYAKIAGHLHPNRVWICWRYTAAGQSRGMAFDGLVRLEDERWAWFPKPYRALRSAI